jgi:hypothetical protein
LVIYIIKFFYGETNDLDRIDKDIRDENIFIVILLKIGTLIDDIYYDEIRKFIKVDQTRSINLIKELFDSNNINYSESTIKDSRKLHHLMNTKHPIHQSEVKAISIFEEFGIEYPTFDWAKATEICLTKFYKSLNQMVTSLKNFNGSVNESSN